ncbi:heavy metal translocating P-type ATPase [Archangium sp.]|uniref:heavy metal translocating P-type ATPase n=1 Tax=Archangium sp. TaxID=1872627 RepID=UPI00286BF8B1|nr:heavy metal translocating P-type ATPase [Archangium sp.]
MGVAGARQVEVLSSIPGRTRYRVGRVKGRSRLARALEHDASHLPGVERAQVNPLTGGVLLFWRGEAPPTEALARAVESLVERPEPPPEETRGTPHLHELSGKHTDTEGVPGHHHHHDNPYELTKEESDAVERGHILRLMMGGAVLTLVLVRKLLVTRKSAPNSGPLMAVAGVVTLITGYPFFKGGVRSLAQPSHIDTDTLVTVATLASLVLRENVPALVVIWLLNLGEYLRFLTLRRSRQAIEELLSLGEDEVFVWVDGKEVKRPLSEVRVGQTVAFYQGQKVAVDGKVTGGAGTVNQAPITGESLPVMKSPGDEVYAGTLLVAGELKVEATRLGNQTAMGRLIQRVEEAREHQAPIELVGERFSSRFVPWSFAMSGLVLLLTGDYRRALTMLVVACPCAAGLATPTAVTATIGNAARRGILIKGGAYLEEAGTLDTLVFDKTGTLTVGTPRVTRVVSLDAEYPPLDVVTVAASGELHSQHPLALAVLQYTSEREMKVPEHTRCEVVVGRGMRADLQGNRILVGSRRLLREHEVPVTEALDREVEAFQRSGDTAICVAVNDKAIGVVGVADTVRPEAFAAIQSLRASGIRRILMLTGDAAESAAVVASRLGIDEVKANLLPEDKYALVRQLRDEGHRVGMVGDGINDAPALALANVGIALDTVGSDVAVEAADIALASNDLRGVVEVLALGRRTLQVIQQNYAVSVVVNSGGVAIGALGLLNPVMAAILHNLSTQIVVLNSLRLLRYLPQLPEGQEPEAPSSP